MASVLITRSSSAPLEAVLLKLSSVCVSNKFGVLATHDLRGKMVAKGIPFDRECRVVEVCNPQQAHDVLSQAIEISTALPCRISVYEEGGRTVLATMKPTALLMMFGVPGAAAAAQAVEDTMVKIMEEACA